MHLKLMATHSPGVYFTQIVLIPSSGSFGNLTHQTVSIALTVYLDSILEKTTDFTKCITITYNNFMPPNHNGNTFSETEFTSFLIIRFLIINSLKRRNFRLFVIFGLKFFNGN